MKRTGMMEGGQRQRLDLTLYLILAEASKRDTAA
jgi:hypothetical protein